ncbi:MAG: methylated-DNA--[protein]-cysteine S-methyltransferase [Nitrospira sp.]|nr:methylated-DNA--[protein]-cysteine S-methyltransferase [Nitrospira sp.]
MPSTILRQKALPATSHVRRDAVSYCIVKSPVGRILLAGNARALTHLSFQDGRHPVDPDPQWTYSEKPFQRPIRQLNEYFSGKRKTFTIALAPQGTPFQQRVWQALRTIPYGRTLSYGQIAKAIGQPTAARAVGAANGQNPVSIIVPCHRVIGSNGKLVGYGGGLSIKDALLVHESTYHPRGPAPGHRPRSS